MGLFRPHVKESTSCLPLPRSEVHPTKNTCDLSELIAISLTGLLSHSLIDGQLGMCIWNKWLP